MDLPQGTERAAPYQRIRVARHVAQHIGVALFTVLAYNPRGRGPEERFRTADHSAQVPHDFAGLSYAMQTDQRIAHDTVVGILQRLAEQRPAIGG
jgi:hypothetical protein